MEIKKTSYIVGYTDGRDDNMKKLYDWIMSENREPAQTAFTAGNMRNIAREFEFLELKLKKNEILNSK